MEGNKLKVLMISTDRKIFEQSSAVETRMKEYGTLVEELHIVVMTTSGNFVKKQISSNVWIYPTNSLLKWFYIGSASSLGKKIVLQNNFVRGLSLITTQDPFETGLAGLKISKKWRLPLQVQIHTDFLDINFKESSILNWYRLRIAKRVIPKANSIRAVSDDIKNEIITNFGVDQNKITVLPIFVDINKYKNARALFDLHTKYFQWTFIILMVSRLTKEKNISFALDVLKDVVDRFPRVGMVIVGDGEEMSSLARKAESLGIERHVAFEKWQDDLASYYKTASMFLLTSIYEGYGMSLVEAGASSCYIVTSQVGLAKTSLVSGEQALVCPVNNKECFVKSIEYLVENKENREDMKKNMLNFLEQKLPTKEVYLATYKKMFEDCSKEI